MNTEKSYTYIAIDVSKNHLQVQWPDASEKVTNDPEGLKTLRACLRKITNALVVFEATGGYERPLQQMLWSARIACYMVNPSRIKGFAQSEGLRAKTDPIDARLIQRFAQEKRLQPQAVKDDQRVALAELMDRHGQLTEQLAREKNRLRKCTVHSEKYIKRMIRMVEKQIAEVDRAIEDVIEQDAVLSAQSRQLQSVRGVGPVTAWSLLAYLGEMGELGRNQLVALAGLAPYNRDSGNKQGKRSIQAGRAKVRKCLYMAAQSAAVHNPVIKRYVAGLRERGKPYKVALVAAMRKLLIHLQTIIKNQQKALA